MNEINIKLKLSTVYYLQINGQIKKNLLNVGTVCITFHYNATK